MRIPARLATTLAACFALAATAAAQRPAPAPAPKTADATAAIVKAAQALLTTLDEAGKAKVQFPFEGPQKGRWSNLPSGIFERQGLRLGDLTPPQRAALDKLLSTALSRDGYRKVMDIVRGDEVLKQGNVGRAGGRGGGRG